MALTIPSYPNDSDPDHPVPDAYAWLSLLALDLRANVGRFELSVHPRESAWEARPLGTIPVDVSPAQLAALMANPEFKAAFDLIGARLYALAVDNTPELAGAIPT